MKETKTKIYLTIWIYLLISCTAFAGEMFDTKGTDFRFTFLPNAHKSASAFSTDSLFIFIAAEQPTSGTIEYYDRSGKFYTKIFTIAQANSLYTFQLQYYNYELWGYRTDNSTGNRYQSENVSKMSFHITTDADVTVYAHSQAKNTSDAFLVYPTDVLDKKYIVASFPSDGNYSGSTTEATPSEFVIVASEDNTSVKITPKTETQFNGTIVQKINLNKGEVYLVQAKMSSDNYARDLTGTLIEADKPVAVFGGHQKASVPRLNVNSGSRDFLMEQIPPISTFGQNAFITPFIQPNSVSTVYKDIFRVIAAYDNTIVSINNKIVDTLQTSEYYQGDITTAATVTSNQPFLLIQFKRTSDLSGGSINGDPFMLVVPPKEQYLKSYITINVQARESFGNVYTEQYITVVVPSNYTNTFKLDGSVVASNLFNPIPNSTYSYANLTVKDGVHLTQADSTFGIYIYGYGTANSFGYTGGMSYKPLDLTKPIITLLDSCHSFSGKISDTLFSDMGLSKSEISESSKINCNVILEPISGDSRTQKFSGSLIDKRLDGEFTINSIDIAGNKSTEKFRIKGFTLAVAGSELTGQPIEISDDIPIGKSKCFDIPIHNYGIFDQTLSNYSLKNKSLFSVSPKFPITIKPGATDTLKICFTGINDGEYLDTLSLINECEEFALISNLKMNVGSDKAPPSITSSIDSCRQNYFYNITETGSWDTGIASINVLEQENCTVKVNFTSAQNASISVNVVNSEMNMHFKISIKDSIGHEIILEETIYGNSIKILGEFEKDNVLNYGNCTIGTINSQMITFYNYGASQIVIESIPLKLNQFFSIPPSQFPIILNPYDSANVIIIFRPMISSDQNYTDTLFVNTACTNQNVILNGIGNSYNFEGNSKCDVDLIFISNEVNEDILLSAVKPNPIINRASTTLNVSENGQIYASLINVLGYEYSIINKYLTKGQYEITINAENIPVGVYYLRFVSCRNSKMQKIIITR